MKNSIILLCVLLFTQSVFSQKIINNPDFISKNFSADVTKVELTDKETIIHFNFKYPLGSMFIIAKRTYIEDASGKGEKLYITKSEGIGISERFVMTDSDEKSCKMYFPALPKGIKNINYGESNPNGNWNIYKLDLTKDGTNFLSGLNVARASNYKVKGWTIGYDIANMPRNRAVEVYNWGINKNIDPEGKTKLPENLPKEFFGSWYDKYGTLILITTPEYIVSDFRVQYYRNIKEIGEHKFKISTLSKSFEILSLDEESMTIRTDRIITLKRKSISNKVPEFLKGDWIHWGKVKEIKITDDYFYNNDHGDLGVYKVVSRIDKVVNLESSDTVWFILYHEGDYNLYGVRKIDGEFVLQPRGFVNAKYKKVKK